MAACTERFEQTAGCHPYLLQYLKSYSTVVVLQWRDVIVAESKFSPSIDLKEIQLMLKQFCVLWCYSLKGQQQETG